MFKRVIVSIIVVVFFGCASVEKYNTQITTSHDPLVLKKDVDYAYNKLKRLHPDLYWYVSEEVLDKKITDFKNSLKKPLTTKEFYKQFAPIITNIKQGHISVGVPLKKNKKELKMKGKRKSPFNSFLLESTNDQLFIIKKYKQDSTIVDGSEIVAVDNEKVKDILADFRKLHASDGYNTTFVPQFVGNRFATFYKNVFKQKDSVLLSLKTGDSLYNSYVYPTFSKVNYDKKPDSVSSVKKKLTKLEKKLAKEERKKQVAFKDKYGYDSKTKEYYRNFKFLKSNDSTVLGYMKIKSFTNGGYKDFYKESFEKIDSAKCKDFVLDLRGNYGGRLSEIDDLYSYLTDKEYVFIEKSKMTKRLSFLYPYFHTKSKLTKTLATIFSPALGVYHFFKTEKKDGDAYFKFKYSKLREPKETTFSGKMYVLIDGKSFSASSVLSTHLKATKRAIFVGEETGGAYNGTVAGLFANVELPNSKINLRFGLMKINAPYTISPDGYGIKPDIAIEKKLNDKDEELIWVLEDIKS